jgi:hypothetical protein
MGSFYGNVTVLGVQLDALRMAAPKPAFAAVQGGDVVLFALADDEGSPVTGAELSSKLGCVAFSAGVHDDDIFFFEVYRDGKLLAAGAVPDPREYFGIDDDMLADFDSEMPEAAGVAGPTASPDPSAVVEALGRGDESAFRAALEGDFVFATDRHRAVTQALGLPTAAVGWGHRYLASDRSGYSGPELVQL